MENEAAKPVRYIIQPININCVLIGTEQIHNYQVNLPGNVINDSE